MFKLVLTIYELNFYQTMGYQMYPKAKVTLEVSGGIVETCLKIICGLLNGAKNIVKKRRLF